MHEFISIEWIILMHKQITFHLFFTFLLKNKTASCKCHPNVKIYMHHESVENCHSIRINLVLQSFELTKRESSTSHYRYRIGRWNISFLLFLFFFFFSKTTLFKTNSYPRFAIASKIHLSSWKEPILFF